MIQRNYITKLEFLASHDSLTALKNRREFDKTIAYYYANDLNGILTIIDINRFKHFNDLYGHQFGDLILLEIGNILKNSFQNGLTFRLGGDEFGIISNTELSILETNQSIMSKLNRDIYIGDVKVSLSISIGSSIIKDHNNSELSYKVADNNMYTMKREYDIAMKNKQKDQ